MKIRVEMHGYKKNFDTYREAVKDAAQFRAMYGVYPVVRIVLSADDIQPGRCPLCGELHQWRHSDA